MLSKIKHKLFFAFLFFSSISVLSIITTNWFYQKKEKIRTVSKQLDAIYFLTLKEFELHLQYISTEVRNPNYFQSGNSTIVSTHNYYFKTIIQKTELLKQNEVVVNYKIDDLLNVFENKLVDYKQNFNMLTAFIKKRGYKDFGVEGEMRTWAHNLQSLKTEIDQVSVLSLRRHEKDFIIRNEYQYARKLERELTDLQISINKSKTISAKRKNEINKILDKYLDTFKKYVSIEKILGIKENSGLQNTLAFSMKDIQLFLDNGKSTILSIENDLLAKLNYTILGIILLILILSIVLSYYMALAITKPIADITAFVQKYVQSNYSKVPVIHQLPNSKELKVLTKSFLRMAFEINTYLNKFKDKVEERTKEVRLQNEEIENQKQKIIAQRDALEKQKQILETQKKLLTEKNKNVTDSIRYAKRIQKAILPPKNIIKESLENYFIFYQPKDIISGDFYWVDKIISPSILGGVTSNKWDSDISLNNQQKILQVNHTSLFAAVDCTGHGVPGALMSMIGYNTLNKIVQEYRITEPALILDQLNKEIKNVLRQNNSKTSVNDGMDIALCSINRNNNTLEFAGANNPVYIVRENEVHVIKGNKQPIGVHHQNSIPNFTNHQIKLQKNDCVYIFSDGFIDQFGGPNEKKFMQKNFKELLQSIQSKSMREQKQLIKSSFYQWKGELQQVDDVLVIGVKI